MAEPGESGRRKYRMRVHAAQAAMLAMLPEIESLAARFRAIDAQLEPREPTDEFVFGRPGRESLRYSTACDADLTADALLEALTHARRGAEQTHADLLARWEEDQEREARCYRSVDCRVILVNG